MAGSILMEEPCWRRRVDNPSIDGREDKQSSTLAGRRLRHALENSRRPASRRLTNYQAVTGRIPGDLFEVFPYPLPLVQGLLPIAGRFERASVHDGIYAMHLAIFGQSS